MAAAGGGTGATLGGGVLVQGGGLDLVAYSVDSGKQRWTHDFSELLTGRQPTDEVMYEPVAGVAGVFDGLGDCGSN